MLGSNNPEIFQFQTFFPKTNPLSIYLNLNKKCITLNTVDKAVLYSNNKTPTKNSFRDSGDSRSNTIFFRRLYFSLLIVLDNYELLILLSAA